jgi:hypothetical protein
MFSIVNSADAFLPAMSVVVVGTAARASASTNGEYTPMGEGVAPS